MAEAWRSHAYGLALEGDPAGLELPAGGDGAASRRTVLRPMGAAELDAAWPVGARRLAEERPEPDRPPRTIDEHPVAGWRLDAPGWGLARVARDGAVVDCAREGAEAWRWQRFLVGRVLPFAAVAAGLEVLHAAAVSLKGGVLALSGPAGAGKSSVAAALVLRGCPLLADDVLALEPRQDHVLAHPGPPILAVREAEAAALGAERMARLGAPAGEGGGKAYVTTTRVAAPAPLARVALLRRTVEPGGVEVRELRSPGPRVLLGALFVPELSTAERVRGHLELLARVAAQVPFVEINAGIDATAEDVAEALVG